MVLGNWELLEAVWQVGEGSSLSSQNLRTKTAWQMRPTPHEGPSLDLLVINTVFKERGQVLPTPGGSEGRATLYADEAIPGEGRQL